MTTKQIKLSLITLIENINNFKLLESIYELLNAYQGKKQSKDFWDFLTDEQKKDLDEALKEINYEDNLITNELVMDRARKCLKK